MNKKKVLIIEDDAEICEAMQLILEYAEYEVETNVNIQEIQAMQDLPDVILLDIWLSGVNGKDICANLKSQERTKHIPIIMCSANKEIKQIAAEAGADDFLAKPFEMNDFLARVEKMVS